MDIKLNFNQKILKTPEKYQSEIYSALIDCTVDGKPSQLSVTFDVYIATSVTVITRATVIRNGYNVASNLVLSKSGGYGFDRVTAACASGFSTMFYDSEYRNHDARAILIDLASKISTKDKFIMSTRYGMYIENCIAGAEGVNIR